MSLDPTDNEIASFDTVLKIAQWVQMQGAVDQPQTPLGAFFQLMGAAADTHPRVVGFLDEADYKAVLQGWVFIHPNEQQARAPTPVVLAQAGLVGRVCRITIGKDAGGITLCANVHPGSAETSGLDLAERAKNSSHQSWLCASRASPRK